MGAEAAPLRNQSHLESNLELDLQKHNRVDALLRCLRLSIDVPGEYSLTRRTGLFANLRTIDDATEDQEVAGPSTPTPALFHQRLDFGSLWTFGLKGTI